MKTNPSLTIEQIGKAIGIGRTSVYKIVKSLKEIGVIEHKGRKSEGKWIVKNN
ncbi:helix-turn-helix domain-containing protein [Prevotella sp.]|uniref:helix-turn-helix domain-containing protein n=1 Tax=Prevotella sp. TaxID=59823 RepID=UPI0035B12043